MQEVWGSIPHGSTGDPALPRAGFLRSLPRLGRHPREGVVAAHLSGGTRQKLNVVLSELNRPELILLDEPYQGFDQDPYLDFWDQVFRWRDCGAGILVVTHLLHDLDRVDHVLELHPAEES